MPRARKIKYGFFINEKLSELDFPIRMLFAGLWTIADREGKLEDRPKKIHAQLFPYDYDLRIDQFLDALQDAQFLRRYKIGDAQYIQILNFNVHQNPHKNEAASVIPNPETQKHGASMIQAPDKHGARMPCTLDLVPCNYKKETKAKKKELRSKFEQFYAQYPRHKDRERAWKVFEKINSNDELFVKIMNAVKNQKAEYDLNKSDSTYEFFKYAAPWLNGKCWTDEVETQMPKSNPWAHCKKCDKEMAKREDSEYCYECEDKLNPPATKETIRKALKKMKNILPRVAHA